jgi:hypothetical protein
VDNKSQLCLTLTAHHPRHIPRLLHTLLTALTSDNWLLSFCGKSISPDPGEHPISFHHFDDRVHTQAALGKVIQDRHDAMHNGISWVENRAPIRQTSGKGGRTYR